MTASDTFRFTEVSTKVRRIFELSGPFGGATAAIGYIDPAGDFVPFRKSTGGDPVTTLVADGWVVETPSSGQFAVTITGATASTAIKLTISEASK